MLAIAELRHSRIAALAALFLALFAALMVGARATHAANALQVDDATLAYSGSDSHTKVFFDDVFDANLPDFLPGKLTGKMRVRVRFDTITSATMTPNADVALNQSTPIRKGDTLSFNTQLSSNAADPGDSTLVIQTEPELHVFFDVEPQDGDAFECTPADFVAGGPIGDVAPTQDGDATCKYLHVTADSLPLLGLPRDFTLFQQSVPLQYGGVGGFHNDAQLFSVPVCKIASKLFAPLSFLGDACRIRVVGTVDGTLLVNNAATDGFRASGQVVMDQPLSTQFSSLLTIPVLQGSPKSLFWSSPSAQAGDSITIPCNTATGTNVSYQLSNNRYAAHVRGVNLGVELVFNVDIVGDLFTIPLPVGFDLLDGTTLDVTATAPTQTLTIGTVGPTTGPCGAPTLQAMLSRDLSPIAKTDAEYWSLDVRNTGAGETSGAMNASITIPAGFTGVKASTSGTSWSCTVSGNTLNCTNSIVTPGGGAFVPTLWISATATTCGTNTLTASATVSGGGASASSMDQDEGTVISCTLIPTGPIAPPTKPNPLMPQQP